MVGERDSALVTGFDVSTEVGVMVRASFVIGSSLIKVK